MGFRQRIGDQGRWTYAVWCRKTYSVEKRLKTTEGDLGGGGGIGGFPDLRMKVVYSNGLADLSEEGRRI